MVLRIGGTTEYLVLPVDTRPVAVVGVQLAEGTVPFCKPVQLSLFSHTAFVIQEHILVGVQHRDRTVDLFCAVIHIVANGSTCILPLFSGHQHYPVSSSRTIDSGRGSILQYLYALNIGRVEET